MITWSFGGGVQSAAIAVLILKHKLPIPDISVIADTGREMQSTWDYMNEVIQPALSKIDITIQVISHDVSKTDLYSKSGKYVLLPAYTHSRKTGLPSKMPTWCSGDWKRDVVRRYIKSIGVTETDMWLGISTDEIERMKDTGLMWLTHVYPLIELVPMNREQCIKIVEDYGWPTPPKSRCWMCPNQSHSMWKEMRSDSPDEFNKAVQLEQEIQLFDSSVYLHKSLLPLSNAVQLDSLDEVFDGCDSGYCFT